MKKGSWLQYSDIRRLLDKLDIGRDRVTWHCFQLHSLVVFPFNFLSPLYHKTCEKRKDALEFWVICVIIVYIEKDNKNAHSKTIEQQIAAFERVKHEYPHLTKAGSPMSFRRLSILGRDRQNYGWPQGPEKQTSFFWVTGSGKTAFVRVNLWWRVHPGYFINVWNESSRTTKGQRCRSSLTWPSKLGCWSVPVLSRAKRHHDLFYRRKFRNSDALTNSGRAAKKPI